MAENVKVAVRVRPFREKDRNATLIIQMNGNTTQIKGPEGDERKFNFDHSYWSHDGFKERADGYLEKASASSGYVDQNQVFDDLGKGILQNVWEGYNATLFAYGQTGSGKSYSIVGYGANKGIVPVFADRLFAGIVEKKDSEVEYEVEFSMLEIYSEQVRDLLNPATIKLKGGLKVRENPARGFYVEGLQSVPVENYADIEARIAEGTRNRTVAATNMNATSSRAHTIVGISFVQKTRNSAGEEMSKTSVINLVDLAGSERVSGTGATGERLKEGASINLSLSMLGNVISALAERSTSGKKVRVPFRDSTLTKLLKNALGGNSKTVMIAALSPADINYDETLSTLRYADRAKQIKTVAKVNEDATAKLIRELEEENARLKSLLQQGGAAAVAAVMERDQEDLTDDEKKQMEREHEESMKAAVQENERKMQEMEKSWKDKLQKAHEMYGEQGIEEQKKKMKTTPHLYNLNADPQMSKVLIHFIEKGQKYVVGRPGGTTNISLSGAGIEEQHALIQCNGDNNIFIETNNLDAKIRVNGQLLNPDDVTQLRHNDRILFGTSHLYVFSDPASSNSSDVSYEMAQDEISACIGLSSAQEKSKDAAVIREGLAELRPAVDQANSISEELDQKVKFDVLVVPPHYRGVEVGKTELMVRMTHLENGMSWVWSKEKFINQKYIMQELYEETASGQKPSQENSPFVEDASADSLIGCAVISPECLAYMIDTNQQLPIIGYGGENAGVLNVSLIPFDSKGREVTDEKSLEFIDDPKELINKAYKVKVNIDNARGLPKRFKDVFIKYDMFLETDNKTKVVTGTSNPDFNYTTTHKFKPVTAELISWLKKGNLIFQVWGKQQGEVKGRHRLTTKQLSKSNSLATAAAQLRQTRSRWEDVIKQPKGFMQRRCENLENKLHLFRKVIEEAEARKFETIKVSSLKKVLIAQPESESSHRVMEKVLKENAEQGDGKQTSQACSLM